LIYQRPEHVEAGTARDEALSLAGGLVKEFPESTDALNVMGWAWYSFGDSTAAHACWEESLRLDPDNAPAYFCMGRVASEMGDHARAAEMFREALHRDPSSIEASAKLAQALVELDKSREVVALLEGNVPPDLAGLPHRSWLSQAYLALGELEEAKRHLEFIVASSPSDREAHYLLAQVCAKLGEQAAAEEYLGKVERLHEADLRGRQKRHALRGDDAARGLLGSIYYLAGHLYSDRGLVLQAEKTWQQGKARDPADTKNRRALVRLFRNQGRLVAAVKVQEEIRDVEPETALHALEVAQLWGQLGRITEGEEVLRDILQQFPTWGRGYAELARLFLKSEGKLEEAREAAKKAVELDPTAAHYSLLGATCWKTGDYDQARKAVEQAVALDPKNAEYQRLQEHVRENL
jgi:tetratricopeptide (TPR) repeat protein